MLGMFDSIVSDIPCIDDGDDITSKLSKFVYSSW